MVSNNVDLTSELRRRIARDNRTPIRIVMELAAFLWNRRIGLPGFGSSSSAGDYAAATIARRRA